MSCKTLNIEALPIVQYKVSIVEENGTETPIDYVEYSAELLPMTTNLVDIEQSDSEVEYSTGPNFIVKDSQLSFSFLYCVAYRHPSLPEWILARGWWNDEGIWTPEGIFPM